ncbi:MAG: glycoside hydrolase family 130 protein [Actinomycetota bacterium]
MVHQPDPRELFQRYQGNPIITASSFPRMVNAVFNPAAVMFEGETLLLVRVEDRSGLSRLVVATSADGYTDWHVDMDRGLAPDLDSFEERWGVEDARITRTEDGFLIVYTGFSTGGPLVCLAKTQDFVEFERCGVIQSPEDKDGALFPETFGGRWALIHRPAPAMPGIAAHAWLSWSPDLKHWGDSRVLISARRGGWWDSNKVGLGPPPLLTHAGWLVCFHGVKQTASGAIYRLGLALLDRDDPGRVIARGNEWVFGPHTVYERSGDVPDVVFPCGWIMDEDGDTVRMYYGAADSVVCVATASLVELLDHLERHPSGYFAQPDRRA